MKIYNKEITTRKKICSLNGGERQDVKEEYVNMYIKFKGCNAKCDFCEYMNDANVFDIDKFKEILEYLRDNNINIKKINFTGGEPTLNYKLFKDVYDLTSEILTKPIFTINNNGYNLDKLLTDESIYNNSEISLSRHHYDNDKNDSIFKDKMITNTEIKRLLSNIKDKTDLKFNLTCNLINEYIDNEEDIYKYLDDAADMGVEQVGFVGLMPINDFCKENYIRFHKIKGDRIKLIKTWRNEKICMCNNYLYLTDNGKIIRIYNKHTIGFDETQILLYDGKYLKDGYNGNILK